VENRLYSGRPTATFNLENSLAGYLAPWLVICLMIVARNRTNLTGLASLASALLIAGVLFATHSRTGLLAVAAGIALLLIGKLNAGKSYFIGRCLAWLTAISLLATATLFLTDYAVTAAAKRSLEVRWEYWISSSEMIADHIWAGCGPGNFQERYTAYKLPSAVEEVGDPHNFLFEVWSTAGTPSMLAMLAVLGCFYLQVSKTILCNDATQSSDLPTAAAMPDKAMPDKTMPDKTLVSERVADRLILAGAAAGPLLAFAAGIAYAPIMLTPGLETAICSMAIIGSILVAVVVAFWHWIEKGCLSAWSIASGVAVVMINLSAASGISIPGVSLTLWIMIAMGLNLAPPSARWRPGQRTTVAMIFSVLALSLACHFSSHGPAVQSAVALQRAREDEKQGRRPEQRGNLLAAASADPWSAEPPKKISMLEFQLLRAHLFSNDPRAAESQQAFEDAVAMWLERAPDSADAAKIVGDMYLHLYRASGQPSFLDKAIESYSRAAQLYPNSNLILAHLAWALHVADRAESVSTAKRGLKLDDLQPAGVQKLASPYQRLTDPSAPQESIRQTLERLAQPLN
ncbi:MAG: O-antigen ligase family protein, partial [Planctomycetales bacterium]